MEAEKLVQIVKGMNEEKERMMEREAKSIICNIVQAQKNIKDLEKAIGQYKEMLAKLFYEPINPEDVK